MVMNKKNNSTEKSLRNVFALAIIAVSVYVGFEPLIALVPDGVSKAVISSSFGAIFVIILTMYLLNKQTEIEQESKRSERLFDERISLFSDIFNVIEEMLKDGKISSKEINRLPFPFIRLCMLCDEPCIEAFAKINVKLNEIYDDSSKEEVEIDSASKDELIKMLFDFSAECRKDLQVSSSPLSDKLLKLSVDTVAETTTNKDYTKYTFDGNKLPKNRYILAVIKNFAIENPTLNKSEFEKIIPNKLPWHSSPWATLEDAQLKAAGDRPRHFMKEDEVIHLADATICVSNGQSQKGVLQWLELFERNSIKIN